MVPLVAISCLTYNHEKYIRDALEGFVKQKTNFQFVAIIHDDASTDCTPHVIVEYAHRYPHIIKPILEEENQYSKNNGSIDKIMHIALKNSGAKYYAFCEGDDYWTDPLKLQKQVDALESHPECSISIGKVLTVDKDNNPFELEIPPKSIKFPEIITLNDLAECQFKNGLWAFQTSTYLIRKEILDKYYKNRKTYLRNFPFGDLPLIITALLNGKGYYINEPLGVYRHMSGGYTSTMKTNPELAMANERKIIQAFRDLDKATNHEYHDQFIFRIIQGELKIGRLSHRIKPFLKKEFIHAYKEWGIKRTIKEILPIILPRIYKKYTTIKRQ